MLELKMDKGVATTWIWMFHFVNQAETTHGIFGIGIVVFDMEHSRKQKR